MLFAGAFPALHQWLHFKNDFVSCNALWHIMKGTWKMLLQVQKVFLSSRRGTERKGHCSLGQLFHPSTHKLTALNKFKLNVMILMDVSALCGSADNCILSTCIGIPNTRTPTSAADRAEDRWLCAGLTHPRKRQNFRGLQQEAHRCTDAWKVVAGGKRSACSWVEAWVEWAAGGPTEAWGSDRSNVTRGRTEIGRAHNPGRGCRARSRGGRHRQHHQARLDCPLRHPPSATTRTTGL